MYALLLKTLLACVCICMYDTGYKYLVLAIFLGLGTSRICNILRLRLVVSLDNDGNGTNFVGVMNY